MGVQRDSNGCAVSVQRVCTGSVKDVQCGECAMGVRWECSVWSRCAMGVQRDCDGCAVQ